MGARLRPTLLLLCAAVVISGCVSSGSRPANESRAVVDYMNLAKGYLQEGYSERAIKPLKRALEIEPGSADVYGMLGMAYQRQGEDQLAEGAFSRALKLDPMASDVRNNFGAFLFAKGRYNQAYQQFELASQDVSYEQRSRTFENMGVAALRMGKPGLAFEHFSRALRLNSALPRANFELAELYKKKGNLRKAWQHYQAFEQLAQQDARSLLLGVELARANGKPGKAAQYGERLKKLYPGSLELKQYRSRLGYE